MTTYVSKGRVNDHIHAMTRPLLGNMIGCSHCAFAVKEQPAPSVQGSPTSDAAAQKIEGSPRTKARAAVLQAIRNSPSGLSAEKVEEITGIDGNTVRPRIVELVRLNLVKDSGKVTLTKSMRSAVLWVSAAQ